MAIAFDSYNTAQNNIVFIPAQTGKIIRVLKVLITAWTDVKITLLSDPGPVPEEITPPMHVTKSSPLVLHLGRSFSLATKRGRALGLTALFRSTTEQYSITVWYEVVT
ncbi:MAG: hypothetical protein KAY37_09915 [Phycisphaerae bacterium]|nr:hypothetical protein [Phycisphaerae bacterium]